MVCLFNRFEVRIKWDMCEREWEQRKCSVIFSYYGWTSQDIDWLNHDYTSRALHRVWTQQLFNKYLFVHFLRLRHKIPWEWSWPFNASSDQEKLLWEHSLERIPAAIYYCFEKAEIRPVYSTPAWKPVASLHFVNELTVVTVGQVLFLLPHDTSIAPNLSWVPGLHLCAPSPH